MDSSGETELIILVDRLSLPFFDAKKADRTVFEFSVMKPGLSILQTLVLQACRCRSASVLSWTMQRYEENLVSPNTDTRFGAIFSSNSSNLKIDGGRGYIYWNLSCLILIWVVNLRWQMTDDSFLKNDFRFNYYIIIIYIIIYIIIISLSSQIQKTVICHLSLVAGYDFSLFLLCFFTYPRRNV